VRVRQGACDAVPRSGSECETRSGATKYRESEAIVNTLISFSSRLTLTLTPYCISRSPWPHCIGKTDIFIFIYRSWD